MADPLKLLSLEVENILRLKAFTMTMGPDGLVVIEGKNQQGKSSAIKTLEIVLAGMSETPPEPLHGNAKQGHIIATFDGLVVKKVFRSSKPPVLTVTNSDGTRVKGPQTLLDTLINRACLRPMKLMEASEKEQVRILSDIMGFDSSDFDEEIKRLYEERKVANREEKRLEIEARATTFHEGAPEEEVSVSALMEEMQKRRKYNNVLMERQNDVAEKQRVLEDVTRTRDATNERIKKGEELLLTLKEQFKAEDRCVLKMQDARDVATELAHKDEPANEEEITEQIAAADDINSKVRENAARKKLKSVWTAAQAEARKLDKEYKKCEKEMGKARLKARENLPLPELDITEDGILFNGKPFSQAGSSAQLRTAVSVAIKGNKDKRIRLIAIDNGEKLDADGVAMVMQMAQDADYQVVMTKVIAHTEDASESSVVIEDGEIVDAT